MPLYSGLCFGLIRLLPRVTTAVPSSLLGLAVASLISVVFSLPLKTLADIAPAGAFSGGLSALPTFKGLPKVPFTLETLAIILSTSVGVALISMLETLLASRIACDSDHCRENLYEEANTDRLVVGLGLGNAGKLLECSSRLDYCKYQCSDLLIFPREYISNRLTK
jgi:MFS superfamily sulfate permease-like transporter